MSTTSEIIRIVNRIIGQAKKIVDLPSAPSVASTDLIEVSIGGVSYKATASQVGSGGSGVVQTIVAGAGITVDATDPANPIVAATGGGGSGTVTNVSVGNLSPLFTASVANPTTTPAVTFALVNQNANLVYAGPATGAAAAPTFRALVTADLPAGTVQDLQSVLNTGSTAVLTAGITITGAFDVVLGNGGSKLNSFSVLASSGFNVQSNNGTSSAYVIGNSVNLDLSWDDGVSKSGSLVMDATGNIFSGTSAFTFTPTATVAGFNFGSVAADPSTLNNADVWYDNVLHLIRARVNGASVSLLTSADAWRLTGTSTLTGATIIANGGNTLTFSGAGTTTFSHTAVNGFRVTGTIATTSASNQQHTLFDPTATTRATVSDIFSAVAIKPTITAGTTGQTLYGLIVDATGISATNSPTKYAAHFIGGLSVVLSSGAVSPVGLLVNRTTSNGIILNVQSNSSNLFSVSDASASTAVTIVGLGSLTACLNIAGTILTASGESNVAAVGTTLTAGANSDTLRTFRLRPTYGINSRTSVTTIGFLYAPAAVTITSGSVLAHYGLIIDGSVASINIFSGFMVAAPTAFVDCGAVVTSAASLRIRPGSTTTAPGSPNSGDVWHEGTGNRLMFRQGSTSIEVIGTSSVNSISPTSPDRTITVLLNNVTYYIHAKTTND